MNLFRIAWRSIQQRGLASLLTSLSMALGVMLVVAVLSIHGVVYESFRSNASFGYNMIVGAKGGKLQLTLNTVYYLSQPVENLPYDYYLEFLTAERRMQEDAHPGDLELNRDGKFGQTVALAIPICLGDYYGRFRVVATTPDFFDKLVFGPNGDRKFEFDPGGRNLKHRSQENGFFEAVVGSMAAREMKIKLGDSINSRCGDPDPEVGTLHSEESFKVVGILKPTGTANDRAVFVNMEGFYLLKGHAKSSGKGSGVVSGNDSRPLFRDPLPMAEREVTAILVRTSDIFVTPRMENSINEGRDAQAVLPVKEIFSLFDMIVTPIQTALLALTAMICVVSGVSILVSIYNSMSERRHEIAVMRALGAGRSTVMSIILLESICLAIGGGMLGWVGAHVLNGLASPLIQERTGVAVGFFDFAPKVDVLDLLRLGSSPAWMQVSSEVLLIPALIFLAVLCGFFPAMSAYRTDVASSLGD